MTSETRPRLWRVPVEMAFDMVVVAATREEAEAVAENRAHEERSNCGHEFTACYGTPLSSADELPGSWDDEWSVPYWDDYHGAPHRVETVTEWFDWIASLPPTETELEAHGQERLPL